MSGDRSGSIVACVAAMTFLSAMAVSLRFYVRAKLLRSVKSEDWCMLVSMILCVVFGVFVIMESQSGLGRHLAEVSDEEFSGYRKWSYFGTLCYNLSLCFTKLSILLLYLRVLTHEYIRKTTWVVIAIVGIYNAWSVGMYLTMCIPLAKVWIGELEGRCHPDTVWWALTYLHIITDFLIFIIPIPVVMTMTVPLRQKIGLLVVFTFGLFVCLISVFRTVILNKLLYTPDLTWDLVAIANWSTAEVNAAVICGCMPTLRPLLAKAFGPLADRIFSYQHQSLEDPESTRPRTIGSLPLNAFGPRRRPKAQGAAPPVDSALSWTEGATTLVLTQVESNQNNKSQITNMDSDAELNPSSDVGHVVGPNEELKQPPKVYARG
ncbi:hypothetical protein C7999DRAFT_16104 [Corynascus novoguineensis]|uniref:Rhodopsin domain-containing protein n=1 Tax=Corynascus novoguineensis TaxID=1126955 RepID=A0AAN7CP48_9PEZI|nr:hypothetical protein C7999DRAFT_16104 [Corynascus novoguineensis]